MSDLYELTTLFGVDSPEAAAVLANKGFTPETFKARAVALAETFKNQTPRAVMLNGAMVAFLKLRPDGKVAICAGAPVEPVVITWEKFCEAN